MGQRKYSSLAVSCKQKTAADKFPASKNRCRLTLLQAGCAHQMLAKRQQTGREQAYAATVGFHVRLCLHNHSEVHCSHCCVAHRRAAVFKTSKLLCWSTQVQLLLALLAGKPADERSRSQPHTSARTLCLASKTNFAGLCQAHLG